MNLKELGQFSVSSKNIFQNRNKLKCLEKRSEFRKLPLPPQLRWGDYRDPFVYYSRAPNCRGGVIFRKSDFLPPNPAYFDPPPFYENNLLTSQNFSKPS